MEITYFDKDVPTVLQELASMLLGYLSAIALLFLIGAGVYYMAAGGDPAKQQRGKKAITYTILGLLVALLSYSLIRAAAEIGGAN